jgi:hypothetical protein
MNHLRELRDRVIQGANEFYGIFARLIQLKKKNEKLNQDSTEI